MTGEPHDRESRGRVMLAVARRALEETLLERPAAADGRLHGAADAVWLEAPGASFVTLRKAGTLRGCIGSLRPVRSLVDDLRSNALAAAFRDPRFPPLTAAELPEVEIEISLLSPREAIPFDSEDVAVAALRPHIDGVLLEFDGRRGTFLPQVWDSLPDPRTFLSQLKLKAGLAADFWSRDVHLWRYTVEHWAEGEPGAQR